jgi:glycine/D-amino acid oxidase-like deaminating enzyme
MNTIYDILVIGKGLIGSAAAKYLSRSGQNIAITGPDELTALKEGIVFSSHYDQSRIQRIIGKDETWTLLNQQAANEYVALEYSTGIHFHSNVGCLYVNPYGSDVYLDDASRQASKFHLDYRALPNGGQISAAFPDFHFPSSSAGLFEASPSGHINPRLLIQAQLKSAQENGVNVFNDTINDISYERDQIKIQALSGKLFYAKKVLLAAGAFINSFNFLEQKLTVRLKGETTILARVSAQEALRLEKLPSLLYETMAPEIQNIYLVRPLKYPDGNYYLKMGANLPRDVYFEHLAQIQHWFNSESNPDELATMQEALKEIVPSLRIEWCAIKKCIVTFTKHHKPYIGEVGNGVYIAAGGNGYSAMCSDTLGKIAADLILNNTFPKEFNAGEFEPTFENPGFSE